MTAGDVMREFFVGAVGAVAAFGFARILGFDLSNHWHVGLALFLGIFCVGLIADTRGRKR